MNGSKTRLNVALVITAAVVAANILVVVSGMGPDLYASPEAAWASGWSS